MSHWLMGAGNGGVWETHDSGASWLPLSDAWPTLAIGAVTFAPSDPKTIYVGTGEPDGPGVTKAGLGIMKSIDGGASWNLIAASSFARAAVKRIRVHPMNPAIVIAATSRGGFGRDSNEGVPGAPPFGILKSIDGGVTWLRTLAGQATALEIDPANFNNQYAAIGEQRVPSGLINDSPGSVPNGVYRSTDGGQTWTGIAGPWGASTATVATVGRIELALAPSNSSVVYASMQLPPNGGSNANGLLGLYRTDNAWAATPTWVQISTAGTGDGGYCGPGKCGYAHVISVDPADPDTLFVGGGENGGGGSWRCSSCEASPMWTDLSVVGQLGPHPDHHALIWAGNRLLDGTDGGVWSTTDRGASWQNHNSSLSDLMFYGADLHPTDPNFVLGGLRDNGVLTLTGSNWNFTANPSTVSGVPELGEAEVTISATHPDTDWMAAWIWGVIGRTVDGGKSWTNAQAGIDVSGSAFVAPVRQCPSNSEIFLTGTGRMWRTENFFSSVAPAWVANGPSTNFLSPGSPIFPGAILDIAFAPTDSSCNTYVYGNRNGQIQLTRDGGKTWADLDPGKNLPARPVNSLAFDPTNPSVLYAALSSFDDATPGKPGHLFKTGNALAAAPTWVNVSPALNQPFNVIRIDPANPALIYAGTDTGMWRSTDGGTTWTHMGTESGLPNASIYDIKINPNTGRTVAFTYGRGAYALGPEVISGKSSPANGATYVAGGLVPGSWAQVQGRNLSGVSRIWNDSDITAAGANLPSNLSGVSVTVNGMPAAVYYISPAQINFQVPNGITGSATVQVFRDGVPSNTIGATASSCAPGIFPIPVNGKNYAAAVFLDGVLAGNPSNGSGFRNARPGDVIQLYATGLAPSPAGVPVAFQPLSGVTVSIGNVTVSADAAGLVAPGEFQINFTVPQQFAGLPEGEYPITVSVNGISSPAAINSDPAGPVILSIQH